MMEKLNDSLRKIERVLGKAIVGITGTILVAITIIIFVQVIFRKVLSNSLSWSEELTRYMMVWMTFLATGYILGHGLHSNIDAVLKRLPKSVQFVVKKINGLLLIFFSIIVLKYGFALTILGANQKSSALVIPMNYVYLAIPAGGLIMLFYSLLILTEGREQKI